jgi:ribosomal-protein-alanine N-acetyltransferase
MSLPTFETTRLRLRQLATSDAEAMHACYGDAEAMRYWDSPPARNIADTTKLVTLSAKPTPRHAAWAILMKEGGELCGMLNYHHRESKHRRLEVGWILARRFWRQGLMSEAMRPFVDHCFAALQTNRIEATIEPDNVASQRLAERLGFQREGLMREVLLVGGTFRDLHLYALLASAWRR